MTSGGTPELGKETKSEESVKYVIKPRLKLNIFNTICRRQ